MSRAIRNALIKYGVTALCGGAVVGLVLELHGFAQAATQADRYKILADAFTIPGVVIALLWVLIWLGGEGAFLGIGYAVRYAVRMLIPGNALGPRERYSDYVARKSEQPPVKATFLLFTGLAFILIAVIFIILYYNA